MAIEQEIGKYQQQLQYVMFQRQNLEMQSDEYKLTIKRLTEITGDVHKIQGSLLLPVSISEAKKELEEKLETTDIKIKQLKKQEEKIQEEVKELTNKVGNQ